MESILKDYPRGEAATTYEEATTIGEFIRETRLLKDISQKDFASSIPMSVTQLCRIEKGEHRPTRSTLQKMSPHLGIPYPDLLAKARYNNASGDNRIFDRDGKELDVNSLVMSIYRVDSNLIGYFKDFEEIGTKENVDVIRLLLNAMRREAEAQVSTQDNRKAEDAFFLQFFAGLKEFIISSLSPME